ncbi:hypothetical protein HK098_000857 [Nowakowskiella sp. JEL0407]|nr:hypothetical protein HK098_000857 [Nowakowskiella sp. JEL0407]
MQPPNQAIEAVLVHSQIPSNITEKAEGYDFNKGVNYEELLKSYYRTGFQATEFGKAVNEINRMINWRLSYEPIAENETEEFKDPQRREETKCKIFLGYTSNLVSSGIRESIRYLVQHKMVDCLVTTAGGVEEDLIKTLAPTYIASFALSGSELRKKGLNRIGNLIVPNNNYCDFEDWVMPLLDELLKDQKEKGIVWSPSTIIHRLGERVNSEDSICWWAWKNNIPIFCPALTDGSLGDMIYFHSYKNPGLIIDIASDIRAMNNTAVFAKKTGMIVLGGGVVKHHICNANLMRNGADFAVYVNTAQEFDGSDAGARPDEAVSWGKIRMDAEPVKVCADATLIHEFRARTYKVSLKKQPASPAFALSVKDTLTSVVWSGVFDAVYIEEITKKTGNFKRYDIFFEMLSLASDGSLLLSLLTQSDISQLTQQDVTLEFDNTALVCEKLYLIMTYTGSFDRVHYPLPLTIQHFQPTDMNLLQEQQLEIQDLTIEQAKNVELISELMRENDKLKYELKKCKMGDHSHCYNINQENLIRQLEILQSQCQQVSSSNLSELIIPLIQPLLTQFERIIHEISVDLKKPPNTKSSNRKISTPITKPSVNRNVRETALATNPSRKSSRQTSTSRPHSRDSRNSYNSITDIHTFHRSTSQSSKRSYSTDRKFERFDPTKYIEEKKKKERLKSLERGRSLERARSNSRSSFGRAGSERSVESKKSGKWGSLDWKQGRKKEKRMDVRTEKGRKKDHRLEKKEKRREKQKNHEADIESRIETLRVLLILDMSVVVTSEEFISKLLNDANISDGDEEENDLDFEETQEISNEYLNLITLPSFQEQDKVESERQLVIKQNVQQCDEFVRLYQQIKSCDDILGTMDSLLSTFQSDLAKISLEIKNLHVKSLNMNCELENSRAVQERLNNFLEGVLVSPELIRKISDGEINDFFLLHLAELNHKLQYQKSQQGKHIHCISTVTPELDRLRIRASEKIREFLLRKIDSLKTPNTNISIIQQTIFLKYKELYWFLVDRFPEAAIEVQKCYIATVSNYYFASFEKYLASMKKLQTIIADKLDLMGYEENIKRSLFLSKPSLKDKTNVYALGDRISVFTTTDSGIILPHIAEDQNLKYTYESLFKSIHRLLIDNASSEYMFNLEFFSTRGKVSKPGGVSNIAGFADATTGGMVFSEVFEPTLRLVQATTKLYTESSYDAVGILLCIRLNTQHLMIMQKRRIPCLDNFLNATNMLLWPRFQAIIDTHVDSLKKAVSSKLLPNKEVHPHYVWYAEFAASILTLNHGFDDALLVHSLQRIRSDVEALLFRMSGEIPERKNRYVFLINNYDLLLSILSEYSLPSFDTEKQFFQQVLENKTAEFVEEELKPHIGNLIKFVNTIEMDTKKTNVSNGKTAL